MSEQKHSKPPSSGTAGFFQESPVLESAFEEDEALKRVFNFYLPGETRKSTFQDISRFSRLAISPKVLDWCADAERDPPFLQTYNSWGRRIDRLVTSNGWQQLQRLGIAEGMVAIAHEREYKQYSRVYQFLKYHVWTGSCAIVTCPSAMTDGAARLLELQLSKGEVDAAARAVTQYAHGRLISRDPDSAWTSGQWMTERPGGSDVQNTETQATYIQDESPNVVDADGNPLGPYSITGFKWFSSATDANATVLLAQEPPGNISAFFAPTRRRIPGSTESELNGIEIQRLKSKMGTRALPTAELVLNGMRAWRIGKAGQGTKEISAVLNITRVHNAVSAVGFWGRGLSISRAFARVRRVRGKLLMDTPAHVRTLAEQHVEYRAMMHLTFYTVYLLGVSENQNEAHGDGNTCTPLRVGEDAAPHLLRILTPLSKMLTAKAAIAGLQESLESLGGVGYLENEEVGMNVARLYRDCNVLSIWEGTTNIMADDLVRIVKGAAGEAVMGAIDTLVGDTMTEWSNKGKTDWARAVSRAWSRLRTSISRSSREDLAISGRLLGKELGWLFCAILLGEDAISGGDDENGGDDAASAEICSRWIRQGGGWPEAGARSWREEAHSDRTIVFGNTDRARL